MDITVAAPWIYVGVLVWVLGCLGYGHHMRKINLWNCITTTKGGTEYTDPKKLAYTGAFVVTTAAFAFLALTDKLTEWYMMAYLATWVVGKFLGDREQRMNRVIDTESKQ